MTRAPVFQCESVLQAAEVKHFVESEEGFAVVRAAFNQTTRHGRMEVETIDQVLPAVRCNLGIGFAPREMLVAVPELTGVYPLTLDEPIAPRSILFQRKNQPLSIAAKHLRQMLLGDRSREVKKLPTQ